MSTVYGTGTELVDYQFVQGNTFSCMRWVTFFWVPIYPLEQLLIRPGSRHAFHGGGKFGTSYDYTILGREDIDKGRVNRIYLQSLAGILLALGPMTAWILICNPVHGVQQSHLEQLFGLFSILWIAAVAWYFKRRNAHLFKSLGAPSSFDR